MISKKTDLLKWVKIGSVRYRTMDSFKGESSEKGMDYESHNPAGKAAHGRGHRHERRRYE